MTGPTEVRNTTLAFNRMQDRLTRFVTERTHMLAALSHDLRSPLTAMRLRIEMLDETEDSVRLKSLVEEMQAMVEATLEFARGVAKAEPEATVDLAALLANIVSDVGGDRANLAPSPTRVRGCPRISLRPSLSLSCGWKGLAIGIRAGLVWVWPSPEPLFKRMAERSCCGTTLEAGWTL